jgi:hypothetical protein
MATQPQYAATPQIEISQVTTANTSRTDATSNNATVCAGPATAAGSGVGKRITRVVVSAVATSTAGAIRFWIGTAAGSARMIVERSVPAITVATGTTPPFRVEISELVGMVLPGSTGGDAMNIYATTNTSETFNIVVESATL